MSILKITHIGQTGVRVQGASVIANNEINNNNYAGNLIHQFIPSFIHSDCPRNYRYHLIYSLFEIGFDLEWEANGLYGTGAGPYIIRNNYIHDNIGEGR